MKQQHNPELSAAAMEAGHSQLRRREWLKLAVAGSLLPLGAASGATIRGGSSHSVPSWLGIQRVCAWPKLERLPEGTLVAIIFNQPCHGAWEGDLECWASEDEGWTWRLRSQVTRHEPTTVRQNCAVGKAANGDLLVICGGWANMPPVWQGGPNPKGTGFKNRTLRPLVLRSADGGRSWKTEGELPQPRYGPIATDNEYIPFGQIDRADDGALGAAVYLWRDDGRREARFVRSTDDGRTWDDRTILNPTGNETAVLHVGKGRWIAASREFPFDRSEAPRLIQFDSDDDGRSWRRGPALTSPLEMPGHLLRLDDGRILLTYGNRIPENYGVNARISADEGRNWGPAFRIADASYHDCGYPSCIQTEDNDVVTVYYTKVSHFFHYEMRVARWTATAQGAAHPAMPERGEV